MHTLLHWKRWSKACISQGNADEQKGIMRISKLQEIILEAQRIREESWVAGLGGYAKTINQASKEACERCPEWAQLVAMLLLTAWNDCQDIIPEEYVDRVAAAWSGKRHPSWG